MRGAVLAGGAARRYGGLPKGLEEIGGRRILDRVADAVAAATGAPPLLVANDPRAPSWRTDLRTVPDVRPGCGSLGGIYSAVLAGPDAVLCVAWDMPFVTPELLVALAEGFAPWDAFLPDVRIGTLPLERVRRCGDPEVLFFNINRPEDLERAEALWRRRG